MAHDTAPHLISRTSRTSRMHAFHVVSLSLFLTSQFPKPFSYVKGGWKRVEAPFYLQPRAQITAENYHHQDGIIAGKEVIAV